MKRVSLLLLGLVCAPALAADAVTLVLNWVPGADHAPFFYAEERGWYRETGIELTIDSVAGSPEAVKRTMSEPRTLAVADFVSFLRTRGASTPAVAVMALQPRSPYAVYFRRGTGIDSSTDLAGKRLAAMAQDPMRALWIALARRNGVDASQTRWVPLSNAQKPDALAAGEVDAALNPFLHNHLNYEAVLGTDLRVIWWHELGFSVPGQVLVASRGMIESSADVLRSFVAVTQRAWHDCLVDGAPCVEALLRANPQLDREHETALWRQVRDLFGTVGKPSVVCGFGEALGTEQVTFVERALGLSPAAQPLFSERFLAPGIRSP
jgi:NitT/TauT family transport system substrate-binding protein